MEKTSTARRVAPWIRLWPPGNRCCWRLTSQGLLAPPSWEELERRLLGRGTEGPEERERRLATARVELEAASEFDHVVINDDVERAVGELARLIGLE